LQAPLHKNSQLHVLKATAHLFRTKYFFTKVEKEQLGSFVSSFEAVVNTPDDSNSEQSIVSRLKVIECLEIMGKNFKDFSSFFPTVFKIFSRLSGDKKKLLRHRSAFVRNLWEIGLDL